MLKVKRGNILSQFSNIDKIIEQGSCSPLFYDDFLKRATPYMMQCYKEKDLVFPKEIRIPKSLQSLAKKDFEPARIFRIEEQPYIVHPTTGEKINIWYGNTSKGVYFRPGFMNGDTRYPSKIKFDDKNVHAYLSGKTGMGKSVLFNGIIFTMCFEYPPWELKLIMTDSKVAEFKRYFQGSLIPHITSIAATTDADYVISTIHSLVEEMETFYSIMGSVGCNNIEDYREYTKLNIPRVVIPMDEIQTAFKHAGKKAGQLEKDLDAFVRLGRAVGYHLAMASQGVSNDMSKDTLDNMQLRCALGCSAAMSTKILGNDEAKTIKTKGKILINLNSEEGKKEDNTLYRVPFQPPPQFEWMKDALAEKGKQYNFSYKLSCYDQGKIVYDRDFESYLQGFIKDENSIILGEPSFVSKDPEGMLRIKLDGKDFENIAIVSYVSKNCVRYLKTLKHNLSRHTRYKVMVIHNDEDVLEQSGLKDISVKNVVIRNANDPKFSSSLLQIVLRKMMIVTDECVFDNPVVDNVTLSFLDKNFPDDANFKSPINKARAHKIIRLLLLDKEYDIFGIYGSKLDKATLKIKEILNIAMWQYEKIDCLNSRVNKNKFERLYIFILGFSKIIGLGRIEGFRSDEILPKIMLDANITNSIFVIQAKKGQDIVNIKKAVRYFITEGLQERDYSRIGAESGPGEVDKVLGVLYDSSENQFFKFKKLVLNGEVMV